MRWFKPVSASVATAAVLALAVPASGALASNNSPTWSSLPVIVVHMTGTSISVSGSKVSGGVKVVSHVSGEAAGNPTFARLDPGVTPAQLFKAASGDPNNIALIASIVFSPQANRGTSAAYVDLRPGNYVAVDLNSHNMAATVFTIAKSSSPDMLPKPGGSLWSIEFGFRGNGTVHDGELLQTGNHGFLVHMMIAIRARGGSLATAHLLAKYLREGRMRLAMKLAGPQVGLFGILTHDQSQEKVVHLLPGYWVLACFMQTQDGRDHVLLGMERVIHVVK
jgi:hypothetical protein